MTPTQHQIMSELHRAMSEKGEAWVLAYLRECTGNQAFVHWLVGLVGAHFGLERHALLYSATATDARRIVASLMRENGYPVREIMAALNRSRQAVVRYIKFMHEISENEKLSKIHKNLIAHRKAIATQLDYGRNQSA